MESQVIKSSTARFRAEVSYSSSVKATATYFGPHGEDRGSTVHEGNQAAIEEVIRRQLQELEDNIEPLSLGEQHLLADLKAGFQVSANQNNTPAILIDPRPGRTRTPLSAVPVPATHLTGLEKKGLITVAENGAIILTDN